MFGDGVNETTAGPSQAATTARSNPATYAGPGSILDAFPEFANPSSIAVDNSGRSLEGRPSTSPKAASTATRPDLQVRQLRPAGAELRGGDGALRAKKIRQSDRQPLRRERLGPRRRRGPEAGRKRRRLRRPPTPKTGSRSSWWSNGAMRGTSARSRSTPTTGSGSRTTTKCHWSCSTATRFGETVNHALGRVYPGSANHFAVNPVNGDVLAVINSSEVMVFDGSCDPSRGFCAPKESFGGGQLNEPKGLAIDGATHSVYVAMSGGVAVFRVQGRARRPAEARERRPQRRGPRRPSRPARRRRHHRMRGRIRARHQLRHDGPLRPADPAGLRRRRQRAALEPQHRDPLPLPLSRDQQQRHQQRGRSHRHPALGERPGNRRRDRDRARRGDPARRTRSRRRIDPLLLGMGHEQKLRPDDPRPARGARPAPAG